MNKGFVLVSSTKSKAPGFLGAFFVKLGIFICVLFWSLRFLNGRNYT